MNFNPLETARSITLSTNPQVFTGSVSPTDSLDEYRLQIHATSHLQLSLTGLSGNANVELVRDLNGNRSLVQRSTNGNAISELIHATLIPGTYFIQISSENASTNYQLSVSALSYPTTNIVWQHSRTGSNLIWAMTGTTPVFATTLPQVADPNWQIAGSVDFNRDQRSDYLWRHAQSGENLIWLMDDTNTQVIGLRYLPKVPDTNWQIAALGDFDQDGAGDVLWRHAQSGENLIWFLSDGYLLVGRFLPQVPDANWQIAGAKDFNFDGSADIVWRNSVSGENLIWWVDRGVVVNSSFFPRLVDRAWEIASLEDFDHNGSPDLLWRNTVTGGNSVWFTDGTTIQSGVSLAPVEPNWRIAATNRRIEQPPAIDSVGNTRSTAFYIGTLNTNATFTEQLSSADPEDVYQFRLEDPTELSVSFIPMLSDAKVQLLDASGNVLAIASSTSPGYTLRASLDAGTYYFRVFQTLKTPAYYSLSLTALPYAIAQYDFTYYYNGQDTTADYYSGTVTTFRGTYTVGEWFDQTASFNETGANGRYFITASRNIGGIEELNQLTLQTYYDSESATFVSLSYFDRYGKLGDEYGRIGDSLVYLENFGRDYFEADLRWIDFVRVESSVRQGETTSITWRDTIAENVRIDLFQNGIFHSTIVESTESDGQYDWQPFIPSGRYWIRVTSLQDKNVFGNSSDFYRLGEIQIITPNGGEVIQPGSPVTITWLDDSIGDVRIELLKGGMLHSVIAVGTESDGSYDWIVPLDLVEGTDYEILIASNDETFGQDWSDTPFTVRR